MPATSTTTPCRRKVAAPAAATAPLLLDALGDQRFVIPDHELGGVCRDQRCDRRAARRADDLLRGRLTLLTESRKHGWYAECLGQLVVELARGLKMLMGRRRLRDIPTASEEGRCRGRQDVLFRRARGDG